MERSRAFEPAAELQALARYNAAMMISKARSTALLLNAAHALDHMFLLVFATSVGAIAADFGLMRWEDLMPYGTGA